MQRSHAGRDRCRPQRRSDVCARCWPPSLRQAIPCASIRPGTICYLEAHIEQGPRLEQAGRRIGIVTGIVGIRRFRIRTRGQADHAGTTPMANRRDAGAALFRIASQVAREFPRTWGARTRSGTSAASFFGRARPTSCRTRARWCSSSAIPMPPSSICWSAKFASWVDQSNRGHCPTEMEQMALIAPTPLAQNLGVRPCVLGEGTR